MPAPQEIFARLLAKPPAYPELTGLQPVEVERGRAVFIMDVGPHHANPMGTVHGGALATLADSAMGIAYASTLADDEAFTTLELKINFLKPVWSGRLTAEGRVAKGGKSVGLVTCDVTDASGSLVAFATSTCMTLRGAQAAGRGGLTADAAK
jgi:uncharacterized protein (TIGR00369 family)